MAVSVRDGETVVELIVRRDPAPGNVQELAPPPAERPARSPPERPRRLKRIHRKLLEHAPPASAPVPTKQLIRQAGYEVNSWSRDAVTDLCTWGDLHRWPQGVSRPPER